MAVFDDIQVLRPTAEFAHADDYLQVSFTSVVGDIAGIEHIWDFGDGMTSTAPNPMHHYLQPGNYTVTHTVTFTCGGTQQTRTTQVVVSVEYCPELFDCASEHGINLRNGVISELIFERRWEEETGHGKFAPWRQKSFGHTLFWPLLAFQKIKLECSPSSGERLGASAGGDTRGARTLSR